MLRIQEYLNHAGAGRSQMESLTDEMVTAQLGNYKKLYLKDREIRNLIIVDDYITPWAVKRTGNDSTKAVMEASEFESYMEMLRLGGVTQTALSMGIQEEKVPLMFISAILTKRIAQLMGAQQIWAPGVTLCDGIAYEYAEQIGMFHGEHDFEKDIVACAMNISKRYMGSRKRAETLENITTAIFDSMKKIHGMGKRERLFLRLAAILHDCGKYISMVNTGETAYNIIMSTEIIGLSHVEREIVANVVRFNHSRFLYDGRQMGTSGLDRAAFLTVAKLTAILRISTGLDRSHKQKLKGLRAVLKESQLILTVDTQEDITLEKSFFEYRKEFFKEVFSVEPILKQRKVF